MRPSISPVGRQNVGYTITSAVRLQSVGLHSYTSEDKWVVLGHNRQGEMACWTARLLEFDDGLRWSYTGGIYVNRKNVAKAFHDRIKFELEKILLRSEERADDMVGGEE